MTSYPLLDVRVSTPTLELHGATDDLLDHLADVVRAGQAHADPAPYDDPMSFYENDPDLRVATWLRAIWRGRGKVEAMPGGSTSSSSWMDDRSGCRTSSG